MRLKNCLLVLLMIVGLVACDEDTLENGGLVFYCDGKEITNLNEAINLNGGVLRYALSKVENVSGIQVKARTIDNGNVEVMVNAIADDEGEIILSSLVEKEATLEVTLLRNGEVLRTYQLNVTNIGDNRISVSFDAEINENGVHDVHVRYRENGVSQYKLPIMIRRPGSSTQELDVNIAVDSDTLNDFNFARYSSREELYYLQVPGWIYSFPASCHIPEHEDGQEFTIDFQNLSQLDMADKWVLPLSIEEGEKYVPYRQGGKNKVLLHIMPFNDYSGTYDASLCYINVNGSEEVITTSSKEAYVVDNNTVFFYAGLISIDYADRKRYKVFVRFTDEQIDGDKWKIELWTDNADNGFQLGDGEAYYTVSEEIDSANPSFKHIYTTLYLSYSFYYHLGDGNGILYEVKGSLKMRRDIDTSIPDEDEAIKW